MTRSSIRLQAAGAVVAVTLGLVGLGGVQGPMAAQAPPPGPGRGRARPTTSRPPTRWTPTRCRTGSTTRSSASSSTGAPTRCRPGDRAAATRSGTTRTSTSATARPTTTTATRTAPTTTTTASSTTGRRRSTTPTHWVDLFKDAGAKYFVLTSKHHEGVALWDTATSRSRRRRPRPATRPGRRPVRGRPARRQPQGRLLLLALRVVQPELHRPAADEPVHRSDHPVHRRGSRRRLRARLHAAPDPRADRQVRPGHPVVRRPVGEVCGVLGHGSGARGLLQPGQEPAGPEGRRGGQPVQDEDRQPRQPRARLPDAGIHGQGGHRPGEVGVQPRHRALVRLQPERAGRGLPHLRPARRLARGHRQQERQPAARRRPQGRRHDPRAAAGTAA